MNLLATICSIAIVTSSVVEGVTVSRTSLFGYVVAGVAGTLTALEAARAVEAILMDKAVEMLDAGWAIVDAAQTVAVKVVATVKRLVASVTAKVTRTAKVVRQAFFTGVFEAFTSLSDLGTMSPWMSTSPTGTEMVVARVYAKDRATMGDDYQAAAKVALVLRAKGHKVVAMGNRVQVYAAA